MAWRVAETRWWRRRCSSPRRWEWQTPSWWTPTGWGGRRKTGRRRSARCWCASGRRGPSGRCSGSVGRCAPKVSIYVDDDLSAEERAVRMKQRRAKKTAENTSPSDGPSTRHPPVPHRPLALLPARHLHGHRRLPQVRRTDRHHPPRPRVRHTDRRRDRPRLVTRIRPAAYLS